MKEFYSKKGYKSYWLMNDVNLDKNKIERNEENNDIKIGLYSSGDRWEKNTYNQLSACAMLKNIYVDVVPMTKLASSFCKLMNIRTINEDNEFSLKRKELIKRMSKNTINLYVTFTECSPMIPLESFEVGVPCIIGNNTDYFNENEIENFIVVKEEDNIDEIYSKINLCIENKEKVLKLYKNWKKEHSKKVLELKEEFLNS